MRSAQKTWACTPRLPYHHRCAHHYQWERKRSTPHTPSPFYAYTKDETYSDDAVKAMMIALKTNILSYGNYNSSDKEVDVYVVLANYGRKMHITV